MVLGRRPVLGYGLAAFGAAALALSGMSAHGQTAGGIAGVIAPGVQAELVQEGFAFTEGPLGAADGGLYFTDIRASRIHHLDTAGRITTFRENTGGANGLAFTREGEMVSAESTPPRISRRYADGQMFVVTRGNPDRPLLSPNDVFVDAKGGMYFTDPGPRPVVPGRPTSVFYLEPEGTNPVLIDGDIARPNGVILTTGGNTLIVNDTINPQIYAYDVQPDGTVRNKRVFAQLRDIPADAESGADGIAIDRENRLYVTSLTGIQVFDAGGQYLGTIPVPKQPANVAFAGPDKRTLYVTAREGLYRIPMLAQGPERLGK